MRVTVQVTWMDGVEATYTGDDASVSDRNNLTVSQQAGYGYDEPVRVIPLGNVRFYTIRR